MMHDAEVPQVTDVALAIESHATLFGAFPGLIRDALRAASPSGMHRDAIVDHLNARTDAGEVKYPIEIDNALDYLVVVGLARRAGTRWYDIPVHPPRGGAA